MTNPLTFPSTTPNIGLPLLFAGQVQKEFFVNQALAILDAVQPGVVQASLNTPPAQAEEGECYRVTAPAMAGWAGCEDRLAVRIAGAWHFIPPRSGMALFDKAANARLFYRSEWQSMQPPPSPIGGTIIDVEARAVIDQLIDALHDAGLL